MPNRRLARAALWGLAVVLSACLASNPAPLAAQPVEGGVRSSHPVLGDVMARCRAGNPELLGFEAAWGHHFEEWIAETTPGRTYEFLVMGEGRFYLAFLHQGSARVHGYRNPRPERHITTVVADGSAIIVIVHAPAGVGNAYMFAAGDESGEFVPVRPGSGAVARWAAGCGRAAAPGAAAAVVPAPRMRSGVRFDYWGDFGTVEYHESDAEALALGMTAGARVQVGLTRRLAVTLGGEGLYALPSMFDEPSTGSLAEVAGWGARGFAGLNIMDVLEVGYGVMGRALTGEDDAFEPVFGGAGLLTREALRGRFEIGDGGFGFRVDAYTTLDLLRAAPAPGAPVFRESLLRMEALFAMDRAMGLGFALHDFEYLPGDESGARSLTGWGVSLFIGFHF